MPENSHEFTDFDPGIRLLTCRSHLLTKWDFDDLCAPFWRLYWNDRMGGYMGSKRRETALVPNRCYLIPPDTHFSARLRRPLTHFYLHFLVDPPYDALEPEIFSFAARPLLISVMDEIRAAVEDVGVLGPNVSLQCRVLVNYALSRIPADKVPAMATDERAVTAIRVMERSLAAPLTNTELGKKVGLSTNAFIRLFRAVTGRSPQSFFTTKRIERACILLSGSSETVDHVAEATGFCDRYHFSRVFKKFRGIGPAEYRKRAQLELRGRSDVGDE